MNNIYTKYIICRFGELALKGKNRGMFEKFLVNDIRNKIKKNFPNTLEKIKIDRNGVFIELKDKKYTNDVLDILKYVPGIVWSASVVVGVVDIEKIQKTIFELSEKIDFESFRVSASRTDKLAPFTSQELNEKAGELVYEKLNKKVSLKNADVEFFIIVEKNRVLIFTEKHRGMDGLPLGSSGKGTLLLSGGIDSPVAGYMMMKRGMKLVCVHFHTMPRTSQESVDKVKEIAGVLSKFQNDIKLWLVSISDIQNAIAKQKNQSLRIVVFRRFMVRIAEEISKKENSKSLITGESLGQVASQTIENITAVADAVSVPILRPLIGFNKEEIISISKKIGVYDISIKPYEDCCSLFTPTNPEIHADLKRVENMENRIDVNKLVKEAIQSAFVNKMYSI